MTPRVLAMLGCLLFLLLWAEGQEKMRRPQAPEKKATRESKPWVAQGTGRKAKLVSRKPLPKAKPPMNSTAAPGVGKPPVSILSQVVARGQFQKVPESLALQAGDALELRCRGRAVRWRYPAHLQDDEEGRLRVKHYAKFSQLLVVNATAADTGEYSCWSLQCQDSPCQEGEDRTGKTFVFFADPQELFVPTEDYYEVVQLRTNRPTLLPCQVTSPLARVTLHREFPPEEVPVDGRDISYDVRRGFTIHRSRPSYAGSLFCMASLGGVRQISTKYMLVYINCGQAALRAGAHGPGAPRGAGAAGGREHPVCGRGTGRGRRAVHLPRREPGGQRQRHHPCPRAPGPVGRAAWLAEALLGLGACGNTSSVAARQAGGLSALAGSASAFAY
ncbi:platelet-derived growth factor receptor-like protein isoform X1 [Alligator mississippiensis]|uniref:platelet-derived growth factor receptor-like protein isoform X1 n=1 Tax=Alligator mississippiensis TaxID=8496 RepID=UPI0028778B7C|nr:platelet-derived growth factor receptor-like protein isoform X1 [Alligator mississippiensis]